VILLDTHVVLWWQAGGSRLSRAAAREIAKAETLLVSPITFWEIATLLRKGRIQIDRDSYEWIRDLLEEDRVECAPISPQAAVGAGLLASDRFPGDPADRIIYATARELVAPLVTKDQALRDYARSARDVRTIW